MLVLCSAVSRNHLSVSFLCLCKLSCSCGRTFSRILSSLPFAMLTSLRKGKNNQFQGMLIVKEHRTDYDTPTLLLRWLEQNGASVAFFVTGEARDLFLHMETMCMSVALCTSCVCFPLSFISPVLKKMLFPLPQSFFFLLTFLVKSMLEDFYLNSIVGKVSGIDLMFAYKGGVAL